MSPWRFIFDWSAHRLAHARLIFILCLIASSISLSTSAQVVDTASSAAPASTDVTVIASTPLPGVGVDIDKLPGNIRTIGVPDLTREGSASVTTGLNSRLGSVSINDNLDDPFQPDILFRGFEASPVLGTPEGLAVYQNGVRVNEAFGDGLNWDLFPDIAVDRITVVSSNPVYGLNALGGAVVIDMKNGFTYRGGEAELSGGSWVQRSGSLQYGASSGPFGLYVAGRALNEDGWRQFSPDSLRQFYSDFSYHTQKLTIDVSFTAADNSLSGESPAPKQELTVDRSLVFTSPQENVNRLAFATINGSYLLGKTISFQAKIYYRNYHQNVVNGNTTNYAACLAPPYIGNLCQPDGETPLSNATGALLPDISMGGSTYIGENDFESIHSAGLGGSLQVTETGALLEHENHLVIGADIDTATTHFGSRAEVGTINAALVVAASGLFVDTPETTDFTATPVSLIALNRYYAVYGTDTLNLTHTLAVTASVRYNFARIDLEDQLGEALSGRNNYGRLNSAIGFTDKLTNTLTAYAGYSEGNRAPTASEIECANPAAPCLLPSSLSSDPPTLRQVVSHTWEGGLRGHFSTPISRHGRWTWSAGLFRTDVDDDIYGVATSLSAGYFQNIGATRRQGVELSFDYRGARLSAFFDYSYVGATFQSSFLLPSPQNAYADANGDIQIRPGNVLPGIPAHRIKLGGDFRARPNWSFGADLAYESPQYFRGDESNEMKPLPGYVVLDLHSRYRLSNRIEMFVDVVNALNAKYATFGVLGDPTGVGAPGIPAGATTNGFGVDNRFESPAPPASVFGGVRVRF